jgi:hypothetical protein
LLEVPLPDDLEQLDGPLPLDSGPLRRQAAEILKEASAVARPKAAWRLSLLGGSAASEVVTIDSVAFRSPLLAQNLAGLGRVFPFLATEGLELGDWAADLPPNRKPAAFIIRYMALKAAENRLEAELKRLFALKSFGAMSPGVLPDWPLSGQGQLFELLGWQAEALGVSLRRDVFWMSPEMSSSGLYFETEAGFHNCRLCPLDRCPLRRFERDPQDES